MMTENNSVCIVCLKTFQSVQSLLPQMETCGVSLLTKFLKFTQNYLQMSSSPTIHQLIKIGVDDDGASRDRFCEKCELSVINPICKVYLELLSAQLRLSWELEHLEKLLDISKRVVQTESGVENIKLLTEQLGIDKVSDLEDFRRLLAQKCQLKRKVVLPQVLIASRCDTQESAFLELETEALYDDTEQVLEDPLACDGADPLDLQLQCGATFESDSEQNFKLEKVIKLEELLVDRPELVPDYQEVEAPADLPSTSNPILRKLLDHPTTPTIKVNFLNGKHQCPTCNKIFRSTAFFQAHYRSYHHPTNCTLCERTFNGSILLRVHIRRVHKNKGSYSCQMCAKVYQTPVSLSIHMRRNHNPDQLLFSCSHCPSTFNLKTNLEQHFAAIHKPGIFPCPHCPERVFSTKKYLGVHIRRWHYIKNKFSAPQNILKFGCVSTRDD